MGKSDTPAPDPRLVEAQIRSLGIQEDAVNRMISMSEDMAPLQRQQMQETMQRAGVLWDQSQDDRQFALDKRDQLSGIQNEIAQESARFNQDDRRSQLAGQSNSDVAQAFDAARGQLNREKTRMGINPNDGRGAAMSNSLAVSEALAKVTGRNQAGQQARGERLQLQDRANNVLAGYPSMTSGSVGVGAGTMGLGQSAMANGMQALTGVDQAVSGAAARFGGQAGSMYGQQSSRYDQAQQQDAQGAAAAGSAVAGIAIAI